MELHLYSLLYVFTACTDVFSFFKLLFGESYQPWSFLLTLPDSSFWGTTVINYMCSATSSLHQRPSYRNQCTWYSQWWASCPVLMPGYGYIQRGTYYSFVMSMFQAQLSAASRVLIFKYLRFLLEVRTVLANSARGRHEAHMGLSRSGPVPSPFAN